MTVDFGFLKRGKTYRAVVFKDKPESGDHPTTYACETMNVDRNTKLTLDMGSRRRLCDSSDGRMKVRFYTKGRRRRYPSAAFRMAGAVSSGTLLCTEDFQELLFALEFFGILVR